VYDMYPWSDRPGARLPAPRDGRDPLAADAADASDRPEAGPSVEAEPAAETGPPAEAMQAVQVALDRRDNGGDAVGAVSRATSGQTRQ
jgi:hypothetical protein